MDYFLGDYSKFSQMENTNNNFIVDDLLDLSNDAFFESFAGNSDGSSNVTLFDSCNSSISGADGSFNDTQLSGNELCVPCEDLAELEWLSNFVEESFSNNTFVVDSPSSTITSHVPSVFPVDVSVPGKARSKRSRAAPCDWSSRLLHLSPFSKTASCKKIEATETPARKCLHCGSEKTPQWRTGPMGPKTLCNACGVQYKSGRLVPEYRPAASPSFVSTKHSNSHRKVVELRKQKEYQQQQQQDQLMGHQASVFNGCDEFLIHRPYSINGPDYGHMM